jgi:predicted HTH domain antitoxin
MAQLMIKIPEEVLQVLRLPPDEAEAEVRKELALALYARGILPFGKACVLAGMTIREFAQLLASRQIARHYTEEDLQTDRDYAHSSQ